MPDNLVQEEVQCESCICTVPANEAHEVTIAGDDNQTICDDCRSTASHCDSCNGLVLDDGCSYTTTVLGWGGDMQWCEHCIYDAHYCEHCDNYFSRSDMGEWVDGQWYCEDCRNDCFTYCNSCHECFDPNEYNRCPNCDDGLHNYSYRPTMIYHRSSDEQAGQDLPYFGIELETECGWSRGDVLEYLVSESHYEQDFYCKEDSSLRHGIEIVSHPRTFKSWRAYADSKFGAILTELSTKGVRAWGTGTAGLHIHVGRRGFRSVAHQARFGLLFSRNPDFWIAMAGRQTGYASFPNLIQQPGPVGKAKDAYRAGHTDAVNYSNGSTIEVRIWRPSLAIGRLMACIEFTHAALEFTRNITASTNDQQLNIEKFRQWIHDRADAYPAAKHLLDGGNFRRAHTVTESLGKENN